ncbi:MAG: AtpZ/AtpI family protein [Anaerolineales bacterium]|nr:AtpZ/AtpI family protein [Anaerolineales bacterium]
MSQERPENDRKKQTLNLTIAAVVSQVGCITLIIIIAMLIGGLWLDAQFATKPLFTILLMVISVPITLVLMVFVVRKATQKMDLPNPKKVEMDDNPAQEDKTRGTGAN